MRRPRALPLGGVIGVVSPASPSDREGLEAGIAVLEQRGFRVRLAPHALDRLGHLAGYDADRASDFMSFYRDPAIDVLWCARGGSSSCRLWPLLDWSELAALPPKMLIGYSDITSLLIPFGQMANIVTLHGPMVFELGLRTPSSILDWTLRLLQDPNPIGLIPKAASNVLVSGISEGELCGGCLSLVAATVGTPYEINVIDKLLFLEDIDSRPWQIERDLIQLREAGILATASGFVIGEATDTDDRETLPIREIWSDILTPFGKPCILGFPSGHVYNNYALPFGVRARLDAAAGTLCLLEASVT